MEKNFFKAKLPEIKLKHFKRFFSSLFGKGKPSQQQPPVQYPYVRPNPIGGGGFGSGGGSVGGGGGGGFYNPQQSTQ